MVRSMQKTVAWGVSAVLFAGLVGGYYLWRAIATRDVPVALEEPAERKPAPRVEPAIRYPIERVPQSADAAQAAAPVPSLDASDPEVQDALARLIGRAAFHQLVHPENMIRHVVATVDNLPRRTLAPALKPVKPIAGPFIAPGNGDSATLAAANAARYTPYVTALESLDTHKMAGIYAYLYPLFQQAYRELGYPNGYFNDRLVEAIDVMLSTPDVPEPIALVQPRIVYQFADPDLEALPSGQKIMLRMGRDNAARVKAKLLDIRQAVTGQSAMPSAATPAAGARDASSASPASVPSAPEPSSTKTSGG